MQDITAPKKLKPMGHKKSKLLIVLGALFVLLVVIVLTYFVTKMYFIKDEPKAQGSKKVVTQEKKEDNSFVYVTSKAGLNLRADANTQSDILWTLPYGAKIKIEDKSQDNLWYKTTYNNVDGWFSSEYSAKDQPSDDAKDWESVSKKGDVHFSLKYPDTWKVKTIETEQNSFSVVSPQDSRSLITLEVLSALTDQVASGLIGEGKNVGGKTVFALDGIKGTKYIIQTVANNKVVYTEDVILLEKNNKTVKITGPADGESYGDVFNLLVWTIKFDEGKTNEKI